MAIPGGAIRPSAVSRSTRSLFTRDHLLCGFRGVIWIFERSSSSRFWTLSTQPNAISSSTISVQDTYGPVALVFLCVTSQTPSEES